MFTLGLTFLECATLETVGAIVYDWERTAINEEKLRDLIARVALRYSPELVAIISLTLQLEELYRPDFKQLQVHVNNEFDQAMKNSE